MVGRLPFYHVMINKIIYRKIITSKKNTHTHIYILFFSLFYNFLGNNYFSFFSDIVLYKKSEFRRRIEEEEDKSDVKV